MKSSLIALVLRILAVLGLYTKGRTDANKNAKIKNLEDKVKAHDIEDELEGNSANDDIAALSRVRRDD